MWVFGDFEWVGQRYQIPLEAIKVYDDAVSWGIRPRFLLGEYLLADYLVGFDDRGFVDSIRVDGGGVMSAGKFIACLGEQPALYYAWYGPSPPVGTGLCFFLTR